MSIYLDYHATTPCDPRVVEAMLPYFTSRFGNPASATHADGAQAAAAVGTAREQVAALIGAASGEVVFTASATESNNLAILGLAEAAPAQRRTIVTTTIEHKSVLGPVQDLHRRGFDLRVLGVDRQGRLDIDEFEQVLAEGTTFLVSIQAANSEIGTVQDLPLFAARAHAHGAIVHSDAVQAVGRIPVDVDAWDVDLLSLSGHKFYGPKGAAALYVRGGRRALPLRPVMFGGGQEDGLRPGTLNVPAIVGLGEASRLCHELLLEERVRIAGLRDEIERHLQARYPNVRRNGDLASRLPGNSNLTFPGVDADAVVARTAPALALSTSSACVSGALEPSYVLLALGLTRAEAYQTLRIGLGRFTTEADIASAADQLAQAAKEIDALGLAKLDQSNSDASQ